MSGNTNSKRKIPFSDLGPRQKRRRIKSFLAAYSVPAGSSVNDGAVIAPCAHESLLASTHSVRGGETEIFSSISEQQEIIISENDSCTEKCENPNLDTVECDSEIVISDIASENCSEFDDPNKLVYPNTSSTETNSCLINCSDNLKECLKSWITTEKNVNELAVTRLLKICKPFFPSLPASSQSLLKSSHSEMDNVCTEAMGCGEYIHFPWVNSLKKIIESEYVSETPKVINITVNIDGLPLYKNTNKYTTYPILISTIQFPKNITAVGIYCSNKINSKSMPTPDKLLSKFISDFQALNNIILTKVGSFDVTLGPFICDAPVRSELKGIVSHAAYDSCERCVQHGIFKHGHVILNQTKQPPRTDENFNLRVDRKHHKPHEVFLESIGYPMISGFVLDYMHVACLGVAKRLILCWKNGKTSSKKVHFRPDARNLFDMKCLSIAQHIPCEFNRKCDGGMANLSNWKASEYRIFLLYTGMVILHDKNIASKAIFKNFLLFSIAMKFLLGEDNQEHMSFVENLIMRFIEGAVDIYGSSIISYNVHSLVHLPEDYANHGSLNNVNAFKFESYLGSNIKGAVRAGYKPLQQIKRHIINVNNRIVSSKTKSRKDFTVHRLYRNEHGLKHYKKLKFGLSFTVIKGEIECRDNAVKLNDGTLAIVIDIIENEENNIKLKIKRFRSVDNFFVEPLQSKNVGVFKVSNLGHIEEIYPDRVENKLVLLPLKKKFVASVLMHSVIN